MKQITTTIIIFAFTICGTVALSSTAIFADHTAEHCAEQIGSENNEDYVNCVNNIGGELTPASENPGTPDFNQGGQFTCKGVSTSINVECDDGNPIYSYVTAIVNFIAAGVGIAIVANVMIGGVQYMTSRGNPQNTQAAISRITNAFIALFAFIFLWAFFNWLIPTGIL